MTAILPPAYYEQRPFPKWNIDPRPLDEYRLMRAWGMTASEHRSRAELMDVLRDELASIYAAKVDEALYRYGDHGPLVSGCVREHFPDHLKEMLRTLARHEADLSAAAAAHRSAAKVATRWMSTAREVTP